MRLKTKRLSRLKIFLTSLLILLPVSLTGCIGVMVQAVDETLPRVPNFGLAPYWIFDSAYSLDPDNQDIDSSYFEDLGLYIANDQIIIGTDIVLEPDLKVMEVRAYEYFLTRYKITPQEVGLSEDSLVTYTVTDAKGFSARIFQLAEDRIALERNNILLYFNRTDELSDTGIQVRTDTLGTPKPGSSSDANGVLIGLRQDREDNGTSSYRTLWIARERGGPITIYEIPEILFPRNVFYQLSVEHQENIDVIRETITIRNLSDGTIYREEAPPEGTSRLSDITFISNDYFSVASHLAEDRAHGPLDTYSTRHVNQPSFQSRIGITGLFGPEGINVMEAAARSALSSAESSVTNQLDDLREDSFILRRYNGRWIYEGIIDSREPGGKSLTYPINFRDNYRVYHYDNLEPRWTEIVRIVPDALDAVSSPGNLFTVVRTRTKLTVYAKNDEGKISGAPLAEIPLENEEIIMHEWALDSYVEEWTKTARLYGRPLME